MYNLIVDRTGTEKKPKSDVHWLPTSIFTWENVKLKRSLFSSDNIDSRKISIKLLELTVFARGVSF